MGVLPSPALNPEHYSQRGPDPSLVSDMAKDQGLVHLQPWHYKMAVLRRALLLAPGNTGRLTHKIPGLAHLAIRGPEQQHRACSAQHPLDSQGHVPAQDGHQRPRMQPLQPRAGSSARPRAW